MQEGSDSQVFPCPVAAPWFPGEMSCWSFLLLHRNTSSDPSPGSLRGQLCPGIAFPLDNVPQQFRSIILMEISGIQARPWLSPTRDDGSILGMLLPSSSPGMDSWTPLLLLSLSQ